MYHWRLLIPVLAVLGSVASFAERSSTDGRERCVDRREQLTGAGPDQRFAAERGCAGRGLGFDRERLITRERTFYGHRVSVGRDDRRISLERQHSEKGHHSRILRELQRNQNDEFGTSRRPFDSRSNPLYGHSYRSENKNLRDSLSRDRTISVDGRNAERAKRQLRTDLRRADSTFRIRDSDLDAHRDNAGNFRRISNERGRFNRDSDSTRQISGRTRESRATERGRPQRDEERVSSVRREESRNSRATAFRPNWQDIRSDRLLSSRQNGGVATNDENRARRTQTRVTTQGIRHINARMNRMISENPRTNRGEESRSNVGEVRQLQARTRETTETARNTGDRRTYGGIRSSISRQARLDAPRPNVGVSRAGRVSVRINSGGAQNARDTHNLMDRRIRERERTLFSRQSRFVEPREDLWDRRGGTRETPENTRQIRNTPEERIRNSADRNGDRKRNTARMAQHVERTEINARHIVRARSASESGTNREIRFDARTENRVESSATTRSEQRFRIPTLANVKHSVSESKTKATTDSSQRESDTDRISDRSVSDKGLEQIEVNWKKTPPSKYELPFRRETAIRDTGMVLKDESNKAQEYSLKHIGGTPMMLEWTTLAFYTLQGVYVCALLYQIGSGKSSQNTKFGFGWWTSNEGKQTKIE